MKVRQAQQLTGPAPPSCPEHTPGQSPASSGTGPAGPAVTSTPLLPPAWSLTHRQEAGINQLEELSWTADRNVFTALNVKL